jgi:hypothetical protein
MITHYVHNLQSHIMMHGVLSCHQYESQTPRIRADHPTVFAQG